MISTPPNTFLNETNNSEDHGRKRSGWDAETRLDFETAILFRSCLAPVFDQAQSWPALVDGLATKGYGLAIRHGRLVLTEHDSGKRVCSMRFLGTSLADLAARLGRPCVRALPGQTAAGELLCGSVTRSPAR